MPLIKPMSYNLLRLRLERYLEMSELEVVWKPFLNCIGQCLSMQFPLVKLRYLLLSRIFNPSREWHQNSNFKLTILIQNQPSALVSFMEFHENPPYPTEQIYLNNYHTGQYLIK